MTNESSPSNSDLERTILFEYVENAISHKDSQNGFQAILIYIERKLRLYPSLKLWDPIDVFMEAHKRAETCRERQEEIRNIPGWFRKTSFNIIREWDRRESKTISLSTPFQANDGVQEGDSYLDLISRVKEADFLDQLAMMDALEKISSLDLKMLELQAFGLSLKEVREKLISDGEILPEQLTVNAVAQKISRARAIIRQNYSA
jgi:hypothetical protein